MNRFRDVYTLVLSALLAVALSITLAMLLMQGYAAEQGGTVVVTTTAADSMPAGGQASAADGRYI